MNIGEGTMVKLTAEIKEAFGKMKVFPVATATKDGTPNVIPLGIAELVSDDKVWFVDNFMNKTLSNIRVNPKLLEGEGQLQRFGDMIRTYFQKGGPHIQANVAASVT